MTTEKSTVSGEMSRREFVRRTGTTLAGLALVGAAGSPAFARNLKRASGKRLLVGSGEHTYEVFHDWLMPPSHLRFGDTHGLAQDSQGRIYVGHTVHPTSECKDAIAVFDRHGQFLASWGARFQGGSHGLDIRKEGKEEFLYHCDTARRLVVKTDLSGHVIWEKGVPIEAEVYCEGAPFIPTNVTFGTAGDFYVTDGYGSDWIHQYDSKGYYLRTFGGKGQEPGKVLNAHGIGLDLRGSEPFLVVADRGNNRLQYLTLDGTHVKFVSGGMRQPCHLDFREGLMLVPDLKSVVTLLDENNRVVVQLGDGDPSKLRGAPRNEFIPGKFIHPHDAIFLQNGDILVAEWVPIGRVTLLRRVKG